MKLTNYPGCEEHIRKVRSFSALPNRISIPKLSFPKAITTPGPENEDAAWNAVLPAVDQLKEFYDFSLELGKFL